MNKKRSKSAGLNEKRRKKRKRKTWKSEIKYGRHRNYIRIIQRNSCLRFSEILRHPHSGTGAKTTRWSRSIRYTGEVRWRSS